jgi:oligopeptide transport system substrate-binding protein
VDANGKACQPVPAGYTQADCLTVRLELAQASGTLLTVLALPVAYPTLQESVEDPVAGANWWQNSRLQIGNGPFSLARLEPYVRAVFQRSARYWRGSTHLAQLEVDFLATPDQALALYRAGMLDIAPLSAADLAAVRDDRALQSHVQVYPGACSVGYFFNLSQPPFDNIGVRRAVALAIDRAAWAAQIDQGLGWATEAWIPPGLPGSVPDLEGWRFDPNAARDELARAGFPAGEGLPEVKLTYPATARGKERAEFLAAQLQANLDVRVKLDPLEADAYAKALESAETLPQFYRVGYCAPYPDPSVWLDPLFRSDAAAAQLQGYANPDVDAWLAQAYGTVDPEARADLYRQAQQQIIRDLPLLVMDNIANAYLVRPEIRGLVYTPQDSVLPGLYEPLTIEK